MKPLTADFKILYQRKLLWLFHIVFTGIYIGIASSNKIGTDDYSPLAGIMLMHFMYGIAIGGIFIEILSKPFTFCLSAQIKAARNMLLTVWLSLTLIFIIVFGGSFLKIAGNAFPVFIISAGLLILSYWAGVFFITHRKWNFAPLVIFIVLISFLYHIHGKEITGTGVLYHLCPWGIFAVCIILSCFIYRLSGNMENIRNWRSMPPARANRPYINSHLLPEKAGNFFTERIRSNNNSRFSAHLWGQVYLMTGPFILAWKGMLLIGLWFGFLMFKFFSFKGGEIGFIIFGIGALIMGSLAFSIAFQNSPFHNFLLIERKDYFLRRIILLFVNILFFLCFFSVCIFICNRFSDNLGHVTWNLLAVPVIMLPLFGGLAILLGKNDSVIQITVMVLAFVISLVLSYWGFAVMKNATPLFDLMIVLSAAVLTWGFHIAVLRYSSLKKSLC